jgi:hypothetical protein
VDAVSAGVNQATTTEPSPHSPPGRWFAEAGRFEKDQQTAQVAAQLRSISMKFAKWIVMGSGGVVLALLCVVLISPRTAHALVAALVQVTNTRSNPVPTQDVDIAARHPYTATCNIFGSGGAFVFCQPTPAPPTTGFETVIQSVNIQLNQDTGSVQPAITDLSFSTGGGFYTNYVPFVAQGPGNWVASQLTAIYVDPVSFNPLQCATLFNSGTATMNCTVTGYTVAVP